MSGADVITVARRAADAAPDPEPSNASAGWLSKRLSLPELTTGGRVVLGIVLLGLVVSIVTFLVSPLNANLRYELGVKLVSAHSAAETFSHRPLAFRLLLDGMSRLAEPVSFGMSSYEVVVRLIGLLLAAGAGILLWLGLRARDVTTPGLHAVIAVAAVVFMGTIFSLEPDWMAVVFATAGVGVALLGRDRLAWPLAVLASLLFVASAGMKLITVLTALIGLLVVAVLDRRQVVRTIIGSIVVGLLYIGATALWAPWEITWLIDIQLLTPSLTDRLISDGPTFLLESVVRWPALLIFPAAVILAGRFERLILIAALLLAWGPIVFQAQYFGYHGAAVSVVSAVAAFRALRNRVTPAVAACIVAVVVEAGVLTAASAIWRSGFVWALAVIAIVVALLAIGWALRVRDRGVVAGPTRLLMTACATIALLFPAMTPFASQLLRTSPDGDVTAVALGGPIRHEDTARRVRTRIGGPDVPVTYLTGGYWAYYLRNPTVCRYPSPLFLQRTQYTRRHVDSPSYADNLACLSEPSSRWLIIDDTWISIAKTAPEVQAAIKTEWDCAHSFETGGLEVCPRR
jgi:hypothetical protein